MAMTQAERIEKKARALLTDAVEASRDQLRTRYERRDCNTDQALQARAELLALQRVELNLTNGAGERK